MTWRVWRWFRAEDLTAFERQVELLVAAHDALEASGEWKRHQVYARLIKLHPDRPRHELGLAIERAVARRRKG